MESSVPTQHTRYWGRRPVTVTTIASHVCRTAASVTHALCHTLYKINLLAARFSFSFYILVKLFKGKFLDGKVSGLHLFI